MVLPVGRRVADVFTIKECDAAPLGDQAREIRELASGARAFAFGLDGPAMGKEFIDYLQFLGIEARA